MEWKLSRSHLARLFDANESKIREWFKSLDTVYKTNTRALCDTGNPYDYEEVCLMNQSNWKAIEEHLVSLGLENWVTEAERLPHYQVLVSEKLELDFDDQDWVVITLFWQVERYREEVYTYLDEEDYEQRLERLYEHRAHHEALDYESLDDFKKSTVYKEYHDDYIKNSLYFDIFTTLEGIEEKFGTHTAIKEWFMTKYQEVGM